MQAGEGLSGFNIDGQMHVDTLAKRIYLTGSFSRLNVPPEGLPYDSINRQIHIYENGRVATIAQYNRSKLFAKPPEHYIAGSLLINDTLWLSVQQKLYDANGQHMATSLAMMVNDSLIQAPIDAMDAGFLYGSSSRNGAMGLYKGKKVLSVGYTLSGDKPGAVIYHNGKFEKMGSGIRCNIPDFAPWIYTYAEYKGKLYGGGNFYSVSDPFAPVANDRNLQVFDGENWEAVQGWSVHAQQSHGEVIGMAVYQDDLYLGGSFTQSDGGLGNHVMRYDGENFYDINPEIASGWWGTYIIKMKAHKGHLYACGEFSKAVGGQPTNGLIRWDGHKWCAVRNIFSNFPFRQNSTVIDFGFLDDTLFVMGNFQKAANDTVFFFAKWQGSLDTLFDVCGDTLLQSPVNAPSGQYETDATTASKNLRIYPNPAQGVIYLDNPLGIVNIQVYTTDGRLLKTQRLAPGINEMDISRLRSGIYFIHSDITEGKRSYKIVVR
jgi:hypothetical protein